MELVGIPAGAPSRLRNLAFASFATRLESHRHQVTGTGDANDTRMWRVGRARSLLPTQSTANNHERHDRSKRPRSALAIDYVRSGVALRRLQCRPSRTTANDTRPRRFSFP